MIAERSMIKIGIKVNEKNETEIENSRVRGNPQSVLFMKKIEISKTTNVRNVENTENTKSDEDESHHYERRNDEPPPQSTNKIVYHHNLQ